MRLKCFEAIRGNLGFEVRSFIAAIVFPMTKMLPEVRAAHSSANTHQPCMRGKKAALSTNLESQPELPTRMLVLLNREGEVFLLCASLYGRKEAIYCIHCPPQPTPRATACVAPAITARASEPPAASQSCNGLPGTHAAQGYERQCSIAHGRTS